MNGAMDEGDKVPEILALRKITVKLVTVFEASTERVPSVLMSRSEPQNLVYRP